VAFAVTVPAEALTGRLDALTVVGTVVLAAVLFAAARILWKIGLRQYSGASA
jgi:ABC-2 type transport system permease protein